MTETHCPYCSLQCGMRLTGRRVPEVSAWEEFPVNQGALCRKGWSAAGLYGGRERLTSPLVRDRATGEWTAVSWDDALSRVAAGIRSAQARGGPDAVAVFGGGGLTNEKAYSLGKLARVALGTSQIDYNGRWCMSSAASAGIRALGVDRGLPFPLSDVEEADVLVLVGSNLAETMPPAARHLDRLRERGGRVVVIDPRRTPTADRADLHLQPVPGTDLALALGVLHLLVPAGHGAHRPRGRAALERHRHGARLDQRRAGPRDARQAWCRLRLPHRPGQRPGWARARAEGGPAARLPAP